MSEKHTSRTRPRRVAGLALLLATSGLASAPTEAREHAWTDIPRRQWRGGTQAEVRGLGRNRTAAVAYPRDKASAMSLTTADRLPPGLYQLRLTLRSSHVAGAVAFHSGVRVASGGEAVAEFRGEYFARVHEPEVRPTTLVHRGRGPLTVAFEAFADPEVCEKAFVAARLEAGGPGMAEGMDEAAGGAEDELDIELEVTLAPGRAVYYVLDKVEVAPLSRSGRVVKVETDRIRYDPGATLKGSALIEDVGGRGGEGTLAIHLEHDVRDRVTVARLPVTLRDEAVAVPFEITLPERELGYAVVAEFVSADGADRSEAAEYFSVASDFYRVAIFGGLGGQAATRASEEQMRRAAAEAKAAYVNTCEFFAWAEDDMVEMSPDADHWFSGQTCYHLSKQGLRRVIRIAHEKGIAVVTYGKFVMSGYVGWKTAYDYPSDHRGQYHYPVGMWEGVNVTLLDRLRNGECAIYGKSGPHLRGNPFNPWWQSFMPIYPDATPRMARIAAEEVVRSADMFGWDGIRWDGQPRGGGQCGRDGNYDLLAARRTQSLVRYFKDIVGARHAGFGHGYNYLMIQKEPGYGWAYEDYELDELCRGGGLIMNESIGNATSGPYSFIMRNLQVEGDLCRERGGYFLGISYAQGRRDDLVESALWAAAGARPYNDAFTFEARRYCTRYSQLSFDERLRRLASPEKVLAPEGKTRLLWRPFVYETPLEKGRRRLVMNLLNLPLDETRTPENGPVKFAMVPGTDPVAFTLTLPQGLRAMAVNLIDPWTLALTEAPLAGGRFEVPAVAVWLVAVVDLEADAGAPSLASLYGPPRTFGVPRPGFEGERAPAVVLDPAKGVSEANRDFAALAPDSSSSARREQAALDALPWDERNARIMRIRERNPPEAYAKAWWKGASLPADLKLGETKLDFGDLAPRRDGRFDVYHGRGAMDYRLRMPAVFAGLKRFGVRDGPLVGVVRQGPAMHLAGGVPWRRYPEFDLLLFTGIPHCAIGVERCYAMAEYVKAGGAVLFTGGEYAFGKGGYAHTVLEREILPVLCTEAVDTRVSDTPLVIEPGPDFAELRVEVDFAARPSFRVWNQVAMKSDREVRIFLKSGSRPVLVGWQVGEGRVACLLVDHRGRSGDGATAFFDWSDWPALARAVFAWLAPDAYSTDPSDPAIPEREAAEALDRLEGEAMEAELSLDDGDNGDDDGGGAGGAGLGLGDGPAAPEARELAGDELEKRLAAIGLLLRSGGDAAASALARQLAGVTNLPDATRDAIIDFVRAAPPDSLAATARRCLASRESAIRSSGYQLLAISGDPGFAREIAGPPPAMETDPRGRGRALGLGLVFYRKADLVAEGRRLVDGWNSSEREAMMRYTDGRGFSPAAPAVPCLDAEALFRRAAWLAYLSRHDPERFGAQFAREWLMTAQYEDYCDRTAAGLWSRNMTPAEVKRARLVGDQWRRARACFERLREVVRPDVEALLVRHSGIAVEGFARAHFTLEFRACMDLLGGFDREATGGILETLTKAKNADLAEFARARLAGGR